MFCVFSKNTIVASACCFFYHRHALGSPYWFHQSVDCYRSVSQVCFVIHTVSMTCNYCVLFDFDVCELLFTQILPRHNTWKSFSSNETFSTGKNFTFLCFSLGLHNHLADTLQKVITVQLPTQKSYTTLFVICKIENL